jgi:hypothetical protein
MTDIRELAERFVDQHFPPDLIHVRRTYCEGRGTPARHEHHDAAYLRLVFRESLERILREHYAALIELARKGAEEIGYDTAHILGEDMLKLLEGGEQVDKHVPQGADVATREDAKPAAPDPPVGWSCPKCAGRNLEWTEGHEWVRCKDCPPKWGRPEEFTIPAPDPDFDPGTMREKRVAPTMPDPHEFVPPLPIPNDGQCVACDRLDDDTIERAVKGVFNEDRFSFERAKLADDLRDVLRDLREGKL